MRREMTLLNLVSLDAFPALSFDNKYCFKHRRKNLMTTKYYTNLPFISISVFFRRYNWKHLWGYFLISILLNTLPHVMFQRHFKRIMHFRFYYIFWIQILTAKCCETYCVNYVAKGRLVMPRIRAPNSCASCDLDHQWGEINAGGFLSARMS